MKITRIFVLTIGILTTASLPLSAMAQVTAKETVTKGINDASDWTDGEVKKIDKENGKITIKHGEIKNLDMPGMTMVFRLKSLSMIETLKIGDKIKFRAEKLDGAIVVVEMRVSNP